MTLHELLVKVQRQLGDIGCDHVAITRDRQVRTGWRLGRLPHHEIRFRPGRPEPFIDARVWLDDAQEWSPFSRFRGFSTADVLANDWRIVE